MILIAAGSNQPLGALQPQMVVKLAFSAIARVVSLKETSRFFRSPAWPDPRDPTYVNAAAAIETSLSPHALLGVLGSIETAFGRHRTVTNAPRTLDLDLIAYDDVVMEKPQLTLPHPRFRERDFVLAPICDFAPDWRDPVTNQTAQSLLNAIENRTAHPISNV